MQMLCFIPWTLLPGTSPTSSSNPITSAIPRRRASLFMMHCVRTRGYIVSSAAELVPFASFHGVRQVWRSHTTNVSHAHTNPHLHILERAHTQTQKHTHTSTHTHKHTHTHTTQNTHTHTTGTTHNTTNSIQHIHKHTHIKTQPTTHNTYTHKQSHTHTHTHIDAHTHTHGHTHLKYSDLLSFPHLSFDFTFLLWLFGRNWNVGLSGPLIRVEQSQNKPNKTCQYDCNIPVQVSLRISGRLTPRKRTDFLDGDRFESC